MRTVYLGLAMALGASALAVAPAQAQQERWRAETTANYGIAETCEGRGAIASCAAVYCRRNGELHFGVRGLGGFSANDTRGQIRVGLRSGRVRWNSAEGPGGSGPILEASGDNIPAAIQLMKGGLFLLVGVNGFPRPLSYGLNGSGAAITEVERHCAELAANPPARRSTRWEFTALDRGGVAQSCLDLPRRRVCAVAYCDAAGEIGFGIDGLNENRREFRAGEVEVGRYSRRGQFALGDGPARNDPLYILQGDDAPQLFGQLAAGRRLVVLIEPRDAPFEFRLRGSDRALDELGRHCRELREVSQAPAVDGRWAYEAQGAGGAAQSCIQAGRRVVCAVAYCRANGELRFALDGLRERANSDPRGGRIEVGQFRENTTFTLRPRALFGEAAWVSDVDRALGLMREIRRERTLFVEIAGRRRPLEFPLRGSSRAIDRLVTQCVAASRTQPEEPEPPRGGPTNGRWEFAATRGGALAQSCFDGRRGPICAVGYCRLDGELSFGLTGLRDGRPGAARIGAVVVDNAAADVAWVFEEQGPPGGQNAWTASQVDVDAILTGVQRGSELIIEIEPRENPLLFSLRGSGRAMRDLRQACAQLVSTGRRSPGAAYYEDRIVGRWADNRQCRRSVWEFDVDRIVTARGWECSRVREPEMAGNGKVRVVGRRCRNANNQPVDDLEFELSVNNGGRLVLDIVNQPFSTIRLFGCQ